MILIIDADPIVYRSGFASETRIKHVIAEDDSGSLRDRWFRPKDDSLGVLGTGTQIAEWLTKYKLTKLEEETVIEPEPVSHALYLVKQELQGIRNAVAKKGYSSRRIAAEHLLLSGGDNYREAIAKQKPYKGNRDPAHKPFHYQAIRDYILASGGTLVTGREADDQASILARQALRTNKKFVVASIDKDLDQIPGTHFDYRQKVFYEVSEQQADRWFWIQVLAGDPTDNIPGAWKIGPGKAAKLIDAAMDKNVSDNDIWQLIVGAYMLSTKAEGCSYTEAQAEEVALETARLVYMQRNPGELWNPPGVPMGTIGVGIDD